MRNRSTLDGDNLPSRPRAIGQAACLGAALLCLLPACGDEPPPDEDDPIVRPAAPALTVFSGPLRVTFEETNAIGDLYYERLAASFPNEPLRFLLNGEALIENTSAAPFNVASAAITFTGLGGTPVTFSGSSLLASRDDGDRSYLMGGGWSRDGESWDLDPAASRERWLSVTANPTGSGHVFTAGFSRQSNVERFAVARYDSLGNRTGTRLAFEDRGNATANVVRRDDANGIIAAGGVTSGGSSDLAFARLLTDLNLDGSFGDGGTFAVGLPGCSSEQVTHIDLPVVGGDQYYVAGASGTCGGEVRMGIVQLDFRGRLVSGFGSGGTLLIPADVRSRMAGVATAVVGGTRWIYVAAKRGLDCSIGSNGNGNCRLALTRLNFTSGAQDRAFGSNGWVILNSDSFLDMVPNDLAIDSSGRVVVTGWIRNDNNGSTMLATARFLGTGFLDRSFRGRPITTPGMPIVAQIVNEGGLVVEHGLNFSTGGAALRIMRSGALAVSGWMTFPSDLSSVTTMYLQVYNSSGTSQWSRATFAGRTPDHAVAWGLTEYGDRIVIAGQGAPSTALAEVRAATAAFGADGLQDTRLVIRPTQTRRLFMNLAPFNVQGPTALNLQLRGQSGVTDSLSSVSLSVNRNGSAFRSYRFPARGSDLAANTYWRTNVEHEFPDGHRWARSQRYAYDLTAERWDDDNDRWTANRSGTDGTQNAHRVIYGVPVYAMTGGTVIDCQRNVPENPMLDVKLPEVLNGTLPSGGNGVTVRNDDGDTAHYAHFQPNTVPLSLCPTNGAQSPGARVNAGDRVGNVGNSGNSTGPHLHVHLEKGTTGSGIPLHFHGMSTASFFGSGPTNIAWSTRPGAPTAGNLLLRPDNGGF